MMMLPSAQRNPLRFGSAIALALLAGTVAHAQDGRGTVAEPTIPAVCSVVSANQYVSSGEPSAETVTNTAPDTNRIQTALSGCASGQAVELAVSGTNNAFLIGPIFIPNHITLLVDGGVTVFGSRNPADYQVPSAETCGTVGTNGNGCYPLIVVGESSLSGSSSSTNANLMGYGIINGRGADKLIVSGAVTANSWWDIANQARSGGSQNNPILVSLYKPTTASIYKITLENSPMFHVKNAYPTSWTAWGVKIITPWTARNSDGIDPTGPTNITIANSVIGDGDDEVAISGSSAATGISLTNLNLVSGHGVSIGSYTSSGVSNMLSNGLYFSGQAADSNQGALHIKTAKDRGGLVSNIKYENVCIQNVYQPIQLDPFYNSNSGTSYPTYQNITYANVHVLSGSVTPHVELDGYSSSYLSTVTLDNVVFDSTPSYSPAWQNATITFSNAISGTTSPQVYPTSLTTNAGTGVTYTNTATVSNANAINCTNKFPTMANELYAVSGGVQYPNSLTIADTASITLNAVVQPVQSETTYSDIVSGTTYTYTGVAAPTANVTFYDGATAVGTGSLTANGTLASTTIGNPSVGTHTYTATYLGDSNYAAQTFGSLTVTVNAGAASKLAFATAPPSTLAYGTAPGTVTVAVQDSVGGTTTSTASVTLTVTGPNSYSQIHTVNAVNGTATFILTSSLPGVGSYGYVASSSGLTSTGSASESVSAATLTVAAQPASRIFGAPNPSFTYQISGYVNNDPSSVVSGAPVLTTTAVRNSPATTYPITATVGTLTAANYNFATTGNTLTVNGGAPQTIFFSPLPNFPHGGSYQLTASATSGLSVTYQVTGTGASVSGSTLTLGSSAAGQTINVVASQAGNGSYAVPPTASQSFTAQ